MSDSRKVVLDSLVTWAYSHDASRPFQLASGGRSSEYIDCKAALSHPEVLEAAAALLLAELRPEVQAVGGLTMGADPLAIAVALASARAGRPIPWFSVRKEAKGHGRKRLVEGLPAQSSLRLAVFDDVVTRGESTLDAVHKCRAEGHEIAQVLALVDREVGGLARIQEEVGAGVPVSAVLRLSEVHAAWVARQGSKGSRRAI